MDKLALGITLVSLCGMIVGVAIELSMEPEVHHRISNVRNAIRQLLNKHIRRSDFDQRID